VTPQQAWQTVHASCVAVAGRGVLILGPSGAGKSALALRLMALGADLVADDRTLIAVSDDRLIARCPPVLAGLIEARGVGLLNSPALDQATVDLVVDLAQRETDRLPPRRRVTQLGIACDLVLGSQSDHFPASVLCYLRHGRRA
jgi:HPr kinase/phosphorylase